ncbi:acyltransferase family protein [Bacteroides fragilis]
MTEIGLTHKKRIEYIDAMRGFTMLLVVFGHVLTHCLRNYSEDSVVYCFFERFRMPMFFFISGYIAYKARTLGFQPFPNYVEEKGNSAIDSDIHILFFLGNCI